MKEGKTLTWEQAMSEFRDKTGRPGPADWDVGKYPEGKGDFPVTGVSWYEAAAYARFARKETAERTSSGSVRRAPSGCTPTPCW